MAAARIKGLNIGIKFCGNCNPTIDTPGLLYRLKNRLEEVEFVKWDDPQITVLLVLNGCHTGCATIPEFKGPVVVVAGNTVQLFAVDIEDLDELLAAKLREGAFPSK